MRQNFVEHMRAWSAWRKILIYLIAQLVLLSLIITTVRVWNVDVPSLAYLGPWLGAATGGLIGIILGSKRPSQ
ncbi:hypothetical protein ABT126_41335 [Streptomyces sp. NPDC002012]|uniref:hypothetical protein n=1 Tax=Streptomyces sp. NPDC002012 TaxID=3154532 RepID=UPI00332B61ED